MEIVPGGTPLPADAAPPSAGVSIPRASAKRLAAGSPIRVRVSPSEPVDAEAKVFVGRKLIGTQALALPTGAGGTIAVTPSEAGAKRLAARLRRGSLTLTARTTITDVAGNATRTTKNRRVSAAKGKR